MCAGAAGYLAAAAGLCRPPPRRSPSRGRSLGCLAEPAARPVRRLSSRSGAMLAVRCLYLAGQLLAVWRGGVVRVVKGQLAPQGPHHAWLCQAVSLQHGVKARWAEVLDRSTARTTGEMKTISMRWKAWSAPSGGA